MNGTVEWIANNQDIPRCEAIKRWIEEDLHRSFADITSVDFKTDVIETPYTYGDHFRDYLPGPLTCKVVFNDGQSFSRGFSA